VVSCQSGECGISCRRGYSCTCWTSVYSGRCHCECYTHSILDPYQYRQRKTIPFVGKRGTKVDPQAKYNVCIKGVPITRLAQTFDIIFPNKILLPADRVNEKVTLSLKNKTLRQIVSATGLTLKS
jgi:hypothetical protein